MKVQTNTEAAQFKPVSLNIVFETKEELKLFRGMISWNESIPNLVQATDAPRRAELTKMMADIHSGLVKF